MFNVLTLTSFLCCFGSLLPSSLGDSPITPIRLYIAISQLVKTSQSQ